MARDYLKERRQTMPQQRSVTFPAVSVKEGARLRRQLVDDLARRGLVRDRRVERARGAEVAVAFPTDCDNQWLLAHRVAANTTNCGDDVTRLLAQHTSCCAPGGALRLPR